MSGRSDVLAARAGAGEFGHRRILDIRDARDPVPALVRAVHSVSRVHHARGEGRSRVGSRSGSGGAKRVGEGVPVSEGVRWSVDDG